MNLILEAPLNSLSFGNVSFNIIRELHRLNVNLGIFPTGDPDLSAFDVEDELKKYIEDALKNNWNIISKDTPTLRLWHLNGSDIRKTKDQHLITFYECSEPTEIETKIASLQDTVIFSSKYAQNLFKEKGLDNTKHVPLGFDEDFKITGKEYLKDVIHFGIMGKYEKRKHTKDIIQAWLEKYGNNKKYQLSCCVSNPFMNQEQMNGVWNDITQGVNYNNLNVIPRLAKNSEVNEFLNAIDIDLTGLSGGEGWNIPAFNATCLGKWSIVLNETSHKDWATKENSILVESSGEVSCEDGMFFTNQNHFNQGVFYTWSKDEVIQAMEKAESKVGQINTEGVKMGDNMTYKKTTEAILSLVFGEKLNGTINVT
tara:strand:- start:7506 stop:8612 length:1107 start_codon:yes stop_codon:yes gene_type:complete